VTPAALALVIGAAVVHSAWNALTKRARDQVAFLWLANAGATALLGPLWLGMLWGHGLPAAALPFVVATVVLHALYFFSLGRAYTWGAYSLVYPVARGLGVALVPVLALFLLEERLSPLGVTGIALVVAGIATLNLRPGGRARAEARAPGWGTLWAVLTGLTIAGYSLVDKAGVARLHPVPYIGLLGLGTALLLLPGARPAALRGEWAANRRSVLVASTLILTSYLLVLFAFRLAKTGYVVAARELSIVFSALIGSLWLGEGPLRERLPGALIILAGVVCVALAR
jgi:drug/metabolite transporter (DMT)-like permease